MQGPRQSATDFWTQYNTDATISKLIHEEGWKGREYNCTKKKRKNWPR